MSTGYNTPIANGDISSPQQAFQNTTLELKDCSIISAATLLNEQAQGVSKLLSATFDTTGGFIVNDDALLGTLNALTAILDQQAALLNHNQIVRNRERQEVEENIARLSSTPTQLSA